MRCKEVQNRKAQHLRHRRAAGQAPTSMPSSKPCTTPKPARYDHSESATHQLTGAGAHRWSLLLYSSAGK